MRNNTRPVQNVESTFLGEPGTSSSMYGAMGPGVVIPMPDDDEQEMCDDCDENIDDCVCDEYDEDDEG
jgi:hypothetical protein